MRILTNNDHATVSPVGGVNPKIFFIAAAFASFVLSVTLWFSGSQDMGLFVGLWVPSICSAGTLILQKGVRDD